MTLNTKAFDFSTKQGVVVITPLGDALSFRDVDIQREGEVILAELQANQTLRLVVDLGHSNYFGSIMIGMVNSFGQCVKQAGGEMFLCNASDDMLAVLKIMKLDSIWPHFPTLANAKKVAKGWKPES